MTFIIDAELILDNNFLTGNFIMVILEQTLVSVNEVKARQGNP